MAVQRAYLRQLALSLRDKEATYDAGPAGWTSASASTMRDHEDSAGYVVWEDMIQGNADVVTGYEMATTQVIVRQGAGISYAEPRAKPHSVTGLGALTLGAVTSTQDGVAGAYRHRVTPANSVALPSIGAQTLTDAGLQYKYTGMKAQQFSLASNGAFLRMGTTLVGSGSRVTAADGFPAEIVEPWMEWGNAKLYLKDTDGTPISTVLATPSQSATNLGAGAVAVSTRVLDFGFEWMNNQAADNAYRPSTGLVRGNFHPVRRTGTFKMTLECDTVTLATDWAYYLSQKSMAFELNLAGTTLIDAAGTFYPGLIVIVPFAKLASHREGNTNNIETVEFVWNIMDDKTNPQTLLFGYNAVPTYLA